MRERRNMAEALGATTMTPEKIAFIEDARVQRVQQSEPISPKSPPSTDIAPSLKPDSPPEIIGETLVPLTTRLSRATANALKRAHLQRKLQGQPLNTQQEIVEVAVTDWLRSHGYLR